MFKFRSFAYVDVYNFIFIIIVHFPVKKKTTIKLPSHYYEKYLGIKRIYIVFMRKNLLKLHNEHLVSENTRNLS